MQTLGGRQFWGDVEFYRGWRIQRHVFTGHYRLLDEHDFRHAWGTWDECRWKLNQVRELTKDKPFPKRGVILIHGILRSSKSMSTIAEHLRGVDARLFLQSRASGSIDDASQKPGVEEDAGLRWAAYPFDYPSSQIGVPEAAEYLNSVVEHLEDLDELHFVGHSLGGLVIRAWFAAHEDPRVKRVVMIGTPNRGAALADMLRKNFLYRTIYGPSGQQLVTDEDGIIPKLPMPKCEFAIIAGARGTPDGFNPLIPGDDDGTVSVDCTKLDGATDFATVNALHTNILGKSEVAAMVERFLECGRLRQAPAN